MREDAPNGVCRIILSKRTGSAQRLRRFGTAPIATLIVGRLLKRKEPPMSHGTEWRKSSSLSIADVIIAQRGKKTDRYAGRQPPAQAPFHAKVEIGWNETSAASPVHAFSLHELACCFLPRDGWRCESAATRRVNDRAASGSRFPARSAEGCGPGIPIGRNERSVRLKPDTTYEGRWLTYEAPCAALRQDGLRAGR